MVISISHDVLSHKLSSEISQDTNINSASFLSEADLQLEQSLGISVFKSLLPTQIPDFSQKSRNCLQMQLQNNC